MLIIGLASRVLFSAANYDAELSLPIMAMETMPAIGVGMILASIFAATMSTADSQVLACTAAITDDIKPEWNQNHKRTKQVTLVVAAFATAISIAGLYVPGGDSVFTLVVLAVYGLGGVFIPLLILRWSGYKPDSTHSIVMMTSAFAGVIIWGLLGFGEDVFPSVPGMGAAFLVHFLMCAFRDASDSNSLGRFKIPEARKNQIATYGIAILFVAVAAEASYAVYAPDALDDGGQSDEIGMYTIQGNLTYQEIASGSEEIASGSTIQVDVSYAEMSDPAVGYLFTASHSDNEQPCDPFASTIDDEVSIEGGINEQLISRSGTEETIQEGVIWINTSIIGMGPVAISEAQIIQELTPGNIGYGDYSFTVEVTANSDGGFVCQNNDDSEIVDWKIELIFLESFTISSVTS